MKGSLTTCLTGQWAPNFCLPSVSGQVRLSDYTGRRHVLLYFMSRFANSVAWRGVIGLGAMYDSLQAQEAEVLVIGRGDYLGPATRFAAGLGLPFLFLSDLNGEVFRRYSLEGIGHRPPPGAIVLVDKKNIVRYVYLGVPPGDVFDGVGLMNALKRPGFYLSPASSLVSICADQF